jgi:hypothetical protein
LLSKQFSELLVAQFLDFCVVLCLSFWSLYCLSFGLRLLVTHLVSSDFSIIGECIIS